MKLAVCEKLPELVGIDGAGNQFWKDSDCGSSFTEGINWPTEGLQVCHEAEKLLTEDEVSKYTDYLCGLTSAKFDCWFSCAHATYEQRLEAFCRVWFPERFS